MSSNIVHLARLLNGFALNQIIASAVRADIPSILNRGECSGEKLSSLTGIPLDRLKMVMAILVDLNIVTDLENGKFGSNEMTALLDRVDGRLHGHSIMSAEMYYKVWENLDYSLHTGKSAFVEVFGMSMWQYIDENHDIRKYFARTMGAGSQLSAEQILDACDFPSTGTLVDIGAGDGSLIAAALVRHPGMRGIAFELPNQGDIIAETLTAHRVLERCDIVCGDMFNGIPSDGDFYIFKGVFHNWLDSDLEPMIKKLYQDLKVGCKVIVVERAMPSSDKVSMDKAINSLTMTLLFGTVDRKISEYDGLLSRCGFITETIAVGDTGIEMVMCHKA